MNRHSKGIETGISKPTENAFENRSTEQRVKYWVNRLRDCENTHVGSYELKSQVLIEMINSVKSGKDETSTAEKVIQRVPSTISLNMAFDRLGVKK